LNAVQDTPSVVRLASRHFSLLYIKLSGKDIELFLTDVKNKKKENPFAKGFSFFYNWQSNRN